MLPYVNIHTHRPTGSGIELRTAGVHPWDAATQDAATLGQRLGGAQAVGETGLDFVRGADRAAQLSALRAGRGDVFRRLFPLRILSKSFRIGSIRKAFILSRKRAFQILIKFKK